AGRLLLGGSRGGGPGGRHGGRPGVSLLDTIAFAGWVLRQKRVTRMDPERVRAIQECRLHALLRRAGTRSAFYREKYRGIDLDRCSLADLPPTSKAELIDRVDEHVTDPRLTRKALDHFMADPENHGRRLFGRYVV